MCFRVQPQPPARPNRCQLFGPGSRPQIFDKMAASEADVINLDLEDSVAPDDKDGGAGERHRRDRRRRLGPQDAVGADQRARHALLVPRRGRPAGAGGRAAGPDHDPQGRLRGGPLCRRRAGQRGRGGEGAGQADRPRGDHRDRGGHRPCRGDRGRLPPAAGDEPRRGRLRGVDGDADHRHRRHAGELLHAARGAAATGPTPGTGRRRRSWRRAAPTGCCRSTGRSATSPTTRGSARRRGARRRWAWSASGRSTPGRWRWPTRSSPRPTPRWPRRARSWRRWRRPSQGGQGAAVYKGRLVDLASIRQAEVIVRQAEMIGAG